MQYLKEKVPGQLPFPSGKVVISDLGQGFGCSEVRTAIGCSAQIHFACEPPKNLKNKTGDLAAVHIQFVESTTERLPFRRIFSVGVDSANLLIGDLECIENVIGEKNPLDLFLDAEDEDDFDGFLTEGDWSIFTFSPNGSDGTYDVFGAFSGNELIECWIVIREDFWVWFSQSNNANFLTK